MLEKITNILIKLGDKALLALPGVIGAVINFILKSAATAVEFIAETLWTLIIGVGGLLYYELKPVVIAKIAKIPNQKRPADNSC